MARHLASLLFALSVGATAAAGQSEHTASAVASPVPLYDNLGTHHRSITTSSPVGQRYFDQGLRLYYAFNHAEAIRAFREAQRLDPQCAMCFWGEALAWGPNINLPMDSAAGVAARAAADRAVAARPHASERERALIAALTVRYAPTPSADRAALDSAYARAMAEVAGRFPDDLDAAVLYGESLMDLRPWNYWTPEGELQPGMAPALAHFEQVLSRDANHPGACHFYIHAVEAAQPEKAVPCAERLARLMPGAGHLVHMPGHIYIRVGRYLDAIAANQHAIHADETYIRDQRPGVGVYTAGYYPHNYDFLSFAAAMAGREAQAIDAADKLSGIATPEMMGQPGMTFLQHHATRRLQMRVRFGRWDEILRAPAPKADLLHARAMWHYARGRALVATGKLKEAEAELVQVRAAAADPRLAGVRLEFNESPAVLGIAAEVLAGTIASARGDHKAAVTHLREAVRREDALNYGEPPEWTVPVRQDLGAALLAAGRPVEAEQAYREDLKRFPKNVWGSKGLAEARARPTEEAAKAAPGASGGLAASGGEGSLVVADLGSCATESGNVVRPCRLAYRTFGRLNARRDNAVVVPTWYGGRSESMTFLLGPGAWVDTTRYYAILIDGLGFGVSSSPSTSEAQRGREFPRLSLNDMVAAQHRLVTEHLKLPQLHAVLGWSMGGMQSIAWGLRHPDVARRVVSVAGTPRMGTFEMYWVRTSLTLLELAERVSLPNDTLATKLTELWHSVASTPANENTLPRDSVDAAVALEAVADWVPFHPEDNRLLLEAVSRYDAFQDLARSGWASRATRPRMLLVYMPEDHVTTAENFRQFARLAGAESVEFRSPCGHMAPVCETAAIGGQVRSFLETDI